MSGALSRGGGGSLAPLREGGQGEIPNGRDDGDGPSVPEPIHPSDAASDKPITNPGIATSKNFKDESGGVATAGESSAPLESDAARRPSARRSALSNTFCQAGGASRDEAPGSSKGNGATPTVGGGGDAPDGGRKRVHEGRGNEGSDDGVLPPNNKCIRREEEGAHKVEPPLPRVYTLDVPAPSHDDDGDESDEGLPMPPDLMDPPEHDAQQFTGFLSSAGRRDAPYSEEVGEERRVLGNACHAQAPPQGEGGGGGSPSKPFACGSMVKLWQFPNSPRAPPASLGRAWRRWGGRGREIRPLGAQPLPRMLQQATPNVADLAAL